MLTVVEMIRLIGTLSGWDLMLTSLVRFINQLSQFASTVYSSYDSYASSVLVVLFGIIALLAALVEIWIDSRHPPKRSHVHPTRRQSFSAAPQLWHPHTQWVEVKSPQKAHVREPTPPPPVFDAIEICVMEVDEDDEGAMTPEEMV